MIRRLLYLALGAIGVVAAALALLYWSFDARFHAKPPVPNYAAPVNALEAQRQDIDYFAKLVALDRAYPPAGRAEAERQIAALAASNRVLTWAQLRVAMMRIAALADNGHTSAHGVPNGPTANQLPLRVTDFSDGIYVLRAKAPDRDLLGARLLAVDGHPIEQVMAKLSELRGGIPAWRRHMAMRWLTSPEILNAEGLATSPKQMTWTLRRRDGSEVSRTLLGGPLPKNAPPDDDERWLSPAPTKTQGSGWLTLLPADASLPLPLRDFNKTFRRQWIDHSCTLYLQMKSVTDTDDEKIADWIAATEQEMTRRPCALILDLRYNGGGDYTNTYAFANKLPDLVTPAARVYILTGPRTFSAAITTAAFVKQAFGDRARVLGEPVGDRMRFLSEGRSGCLPHAKLCFHYSTGMHDYAAPCTDWRICYWVNYFYPVRVTSLMPDERITISFADYTAGRDLVFERAIALAEGR